MKSTRLSSIGVGLFLIVLFILVVVFIIVGLRNLTFGTSGRHSSWLAFGPSTGNDVSGHYKQHFWHKCVEFQSVSVRAVDWQRR